MIPGRTLSLSPATAICFPGGTSAHDGSVETSGQAGVIAPEVSVVIPEIGNNASYAQYVHGEKQARAMERIGWRKLYDTARDRVDLIEATYNKFINALLKELGLL